MPASPAAKPRVLLVILDGWGLGPAGPEYANAVVAADTPVHDALVAEHPTVLLKCSGGDVGLPDGQMGNSEVGHLNLGAGRIVGQDIVRLDAMLASPEVIGEPAIATLVDHVSNSGGVLHLVGLVSDGGVHSHSRHLGALLRWLEGSAVPAVHVHAITDGRDTSPTSGRGFVAEVEDMCNRDPRFQVATVGGRYYAMDRDKRWERTGVAYEAIFDGHDEFTQWTLDEEYASGTTDEFVRPRPWTESGCRGVQPGDAVFFFNFRADRMRQIVAAVTADDFDGFARRRATDVAVSTMTRYTDDQQCLALLAPQELRNGVGSVVAAHGMAQTRLAETEKYAHVTYFFNGGEEEPLPMESRVLVPSPKVATYDLQPEMSADELTEKVVEALDDPSQAFVLVNYANPDMVGHTGDFDAAVRAVTTVDVCLGAILDACERNGVAAVVTADHGNAEQMLASDGGPHTAHTTNPVELTIRLPGGRVQTRDGDFRLADVGPTVVELLGLEQPAEMTGKSVLA